MEIFLTSEFLVKASQKGKFYFYFYSYMKKINLYHSNTIAHHDPIFSGRGGGEGEATMTQIGLEVKSVGN